MVPVMSGGSAKCQPEKAMLLEAPAKGNIVFEGQHFALLPNMMGNISLYCPT
jgi:hypothetical protein